MGHSSHSIWETGPKDSVNSSLALAPVPEKQHGEDAPRFLQCNLVSIPTPNRLEVQSICDLRLLLVRLGSDNALGEDVVPQSFQAPVTCVF